MGNSGVRWAIPVSAIPVSEHLFANNDELTLRQESSGEEDSHKLETFRREPRG